MKDRDASSFDLEHARELSRTLRTLGGADEKPLDTEASGVSYVRFPAPTPEAGAPAPAADRPPAAPPSEPLALPRDISSCEDLLGWFLESYKTETAFIVDNQGFVIAHQGAVPPDGLDGIGAEVYMAFEQLARVDSTVGRLIWIDLEFSRRRIAALHVPVSDGDPMLFVWINVSEAYFSQRAAIEEALLKGVAQIP